MSTIIHERPGVYSSYDASTVVRSGVGSKVVGIAAQSEKGAVDAVTLLTSYAAGVTAFGETGAMTPLLRLLFLNGATAVKAVRVESSTTYTDAFDLLALEEDIQIVVCDSADETVQQALRTSIESASGARRERIAVVGGDDEDVEDLIAHASALNSERMVRVGPDVLDTAGESLSGVYAAAALAGLLASSADPAVPINGAALQGLGGVAVQYSDNDVDLLVRGGVTPLEAVGGIVSPIRGITTRTKTGGTADSTWRELTTILIVDDVIPAVRTALRSKFSRAKNTTQTRGAIRSQVIVELERKVAQEIIDSYGDVTAEEDTADPTVCVVEFSFSVSHGLNQIYLTAHITV